MRLIFKTSSVTPDFFYVFNLILWFSTCSESFEKICAWELLGANVLKLLYIIYLKSATVCHMKKWLEFINFANNSIRTDSEKIAEIMRSLLTR